ncbi:MAG: hypothetical protein KDB03_12880 [Planctomycetales bacterium]|nr:hypothetical protein [Planctomycetales bacterium]
MHDQPVVGDWNGDGRSDIGVFRIVSGDGVFMLDFDSDPDSESLVRLGSEGDIPVTFMAHRDQRRRASSKQFDLFH